MPVGQLLIVRRAGSTLYAAAMGSLEVAIGVLDVPLIVVMDHEGRVAVSAARSVRTRQHASPATSSGWLSRSFLR